MLFRLNRDKGVTFGLQVKQAGEGLVAESADLDMSFTDGIGPARREAYQRLLEDAMEGDARRFAREDGIDQQWRIVDPVLERPRAGRAVPPGHLGSGLGRPAGRRHRRLARPRLTEPPRGSPARRAGRSVPPAAVGGSPTAQAIDAVWATSSAGSPSASVRTRPAAT